MFMKVVQILLSQPLPLRSALCATAQIEPVVAPNKFQLTKWSACSNPHNPSHAIFHIHCAHLFLNLGVIPHFTIQSDH